MTLRRTKPLRVGFASIYSWRPHVEHLIYLARLVEQAGHEVCFLTCDGDMPACYTRALRPHRAPAVECAMCRLGGVRSYQKKGIASIGTLGVGRHPAVEFVARDWGASSASTIKRFESDADYTSAEFAALKGEFNITAAMGYEATRAWIDRQSLDAIIAFNGRMDATRGIMEAARDLNVRYISMERTWFGDGLQLLPEENCLGLQSVHPMVEEWAEKPLTGKQARRAAAIIAARFMRSNTKEWRAYNVSATMRDWPAKGANRVLLLPGSRNEIWGHPDRMDNWKTRTDAFDALISHLGLESHDLVLRAHPNWGEKIGSETGVRPERLYSEWANARSIAFIPSTDNTSTLALIEQSDAVVVAGGSAALEAGVIGKRVLALAPSSYSRAGFEEGAYGPEELRAIQPLGAKMAMLSPRDLARKALRFCYTAASRIPQYVDHVSCVSPTQYEYRVGADPRRITTLIETGRLVPDDAHYAADVVEEDAVLDLIEARQWDKLVMKTATSSAKSLTVRRRLLFRPIDAIRSHLPRGDR